MINRRDVQKNLLLYIIAEILRYIYKNVEKKMNTNKQYPVVVILVVGATFGFLLASLADISKYYKHTTAYRHTNVDKTLDIRHQFIPVTCTNMLKTDCNPYLREWFQVLVKRKAPSYDEELIRFARAIIDPPSEHPLRKLPWGSRSTPQATYIDKLLGKKVRGTVIFCVYSNKAYVST